MYFWDVATNRRRLMVGSRSSCWLSLISGNGMILSPRPAPAADAVIPSKPRSGSRDDDAAQNKTTAWTGDCHRLAKRLAKRCRLADLPARQPAQCHHRRDTQAAVGQALADDPGATTSPAWAKPAKFDFYVSPQTRKPLVHRLAYDHAYHVTAVGDRVFYGSSAEHTVHCLDAYSGAEQWVFFTDGPVRFAPTIDNGRVYAGSDDGTAYCLDAATGKLIWNHTAASEKNVLVPNDGRLVSPWACAARSPWTAARLFHLRFFPARGRLHERRRCRHRQGNWEASLETAPSQQGLIPGLHAPVGLANLHAGRTQHAVLF